jgi:hypothetical protein
MANTRKTIQFNPLDTVTQPEIEPALSDLPPSNRASKKKVVSKPTNQQTKTSVFYEISGSDLSGQASLLLNGAQYGFEVPELGFIALKGSELMHQLKAPFPMSQAISGLIFGGPIGFVIGFLAGKPKPKYYFFALKSSHGKVIFVRLDYPTLALIKRQN